MTHVVAEPCFNCKYTDCVVVCPVECFYEGESMLYIHPDECIDCEACVPECPVEAIFHEDNLPDDWTDYTALNAESVSPMPRHHRKESLSRRNRRRMPQRLTALGFTKRYHARVVLTKRTTLYAFGSINFCRSGDFAGLGL